MELSLADTKQSAVISLWTVQTFGQALSKLSNPEGRTKVACPTFQNNDPVACSQKWEKSISIIYIYVYFISPTSPPCMIKISHINLQKIWKSGPPSERDNHGEPGSHEILRSHRKFWLKIPCIFHVNVIHLRWPKLH